MKKITVVVAVYNAAKHLKAGLDSLKSQTMKPSEFDIIYINDGSTDNSKEVIEQYAAEMKNVTLINLPKNTGWPIVPRNTGIEAATGRYIHFMDCDDFLGEEALERLYEAAEKYRSDVIFGRHVGVNGRQVPQEMFGRGNLAKANLLTDNLVYSLAPHKMFRTSFLKEHNIKFHPEAVGGNEDQLFVMQCYIKAGCITLLDDYDFYFVVSRGNENFSRKRFPAHHFFFVPYQIMKYADEQVSNKVLCRKLKSAYLIRFLKKERFQKYLFSTNSSVEVKKEWLQEGKKFLDACLANDMIRIADKKNLELIKLVQANDLAGVERAAQQRFRDRTVNKKQPQVKLAMTKCAGTKIYLRPSANASPAKYTLQANQLVPVYSSVKNWLEVRQSNHFGGTDAFFVKQKDVCYSFGFSMQILFTDLKNFLKRKLR